MVFYINGYGVPRDIMADGNYGRYLSACHEAMASEDKKSAGRGRPSDAQPLVYLAGGATNSNFPDRTEAGEMLKWFAARNPDVSGFRLIDGKLDLRGNLEELRRLVAPAESITFFCEYARQDFFRFLVARLFPGARVRPIKFDGGTPHQRLARLRQSLRLPLRLAAWYSPLIRQKIEYPLRLRFIRKWSERTKHRP